jgi:hypothetical protein
MEWRQENMVIVIDMGKVELPAQFYGYLYSQTLATILFFRPEDFWYTHHITTTQCPFLSSCLP